MVEFLSGVPLSYFIFLLNGAMPFLRKPLHSVRKVATYQVRIPQALDHASLFEMLKNAITLLCGLFTIQGQKKKKIIEKLYLALKMSLRGTTPCGG